MEVQRIPTEIIPSVDRTDISSRVVHRKFEALLGSAKVEFTANTGAAIADLFKKRLAPKHHIALFDTEYFFSNVRQLPELRFFVCYVVQRKRIYPRIVYKDLSLAWRCASHFSYLGEDIWLVKGDTRQELIGEELVEFSDESTTDLPLEIQTAVLVLAKEVLWNVWERKPVTKATSTMNSMFTL